MKIAFIGLGKVGLPVAIRLLRAGHSITGYDVSEERRMVAISNDVDLAPSLTEAVAGAEVTFSSMPNDEALLAAAPEILARAAPGSTFVETSTVSPDASRQVDRLSGERGVAYLRVALSGNPAMIEAGAMTTLSSGPPDAHRRLTPLLTVIGGRDHYLGPGEQARVMKLVINHVVATTVAAVGEALAIGEAGELDRSLLLAVLAESAAGSPVIKAKAPPLANMDFTSTFSVDQMRKDLKLIRDLATENEVMQPFASLVARLLNDAAAQGMGSDDYAAMAKLFSPRPDAGEDAR